MALSDYGPSFVAEARCPILDISFSSVMLLFVSYHEDHDCCITYASIWPYELCQSLDLALVTAKAIV